MHLDGGLQRPDALLVAAQLLGQRGEEEHRPEVVGVVLHRRLELTHRLLVLLLPMARRASPTRASTDLGASSSCFWQRAARLLDLVVAPVNRGEHPVEARNGRLGLHRPFHELDRLAHAILLDERRRLDPGRRHRLGIGLHGEVELCERALHVLLGTPGAGPARGARDGPLIQLAALVKRSWAALASPCWAFICPMSRSGCADWGAQRLGDARRSIRLVDASDEEQRAAALEVVARHLLEGLGAWRPVGRANP